MSKKNKNALSIGERLRLLRKRFFKGSIKKLSEKMGSRFSVSGISRRESGILKIDEDYLGLFCEAVELPAKERQLLLSSVNLSVLAPEQKQINRDEEFMRLIENSQTIENHSLIVPSYLQTLGYTHTLFKDHRRTDNFVEFIAERRKRLDRIMTDKARRIRLTLPESALYIPIGSAEIMEEQLKDLLNFNPSEGVEFRVVPINVFVNVPIHYFFTIVDGQYAMSENRVRSVPQNDLEKIGRLRDDFEVIWQAAARGEKLHRLLERALAHYQMMLP